MDYLKISLVSRMIIETICLALLFTYNFITKLRIPSLTTFLQLLENLWLDIPNILIYYKSKYCPEFIRYFYFLLMHPKRNIVYLQ